MPKHFRHSTNTKQFRNYGNDAKSRCDFSLVLKVCREFDDATTAGKLFHVCVTATTVDTIFEQTADNKKVSLAYCKR